jgi:hypothetical protein
MQIVLDRDASAQALTAAAAVKITGEWTEVMITSAFCDHGCKLYARRVGTELEYQVMHNITYSCRLASDPERAHVRIMMADEQMDLVESLTAHIKTLSNDQLQSAAGQLRGLDQTQPVVMVSRVLVQNELQARAGA